MLWRRCGLCSRRNRKINIVLGASGKNVTKTLQNRILLQVSQHFCRPLLFRYQGVTQTYHNQTDQQKKITFQRQQRHTCLARTQIMLQCPLLRRDQKSEKFFNFITLLGQTRVFHSVRQHYWDLDGRFILDTRLLAAHSSCTAGIQD